MYLVGIDVGTTNTKAVIFDVETGQICAVGSSRTMTRHPRVERSEFDADELWSTVVESLRQAIAQCEHPERIRAISVASMGETGFPLDANGQVLYPAIAWYDQRTTVQAQWWRDTLGSERVYDITGHVLHGMFGINKLLWLRDNEPAIFARIGHWLSIEDFVLWKLSGEIATDYSIASRTMVFDQHALTWSEPLLRQANIPVEWFPPAFPGGTTIGTLRREIAEETGLPQQTSVVTGGHDHLCGALAAGVTRPGQFLDSTGTTSVTLALSKTFQPSDELRATGYTTYAYVVRDTYATLGSMSFAGGALEWLVTLLYGQGASVTDEVYAQAVREGAQIPPGSRGAIVLPYFLGAGTPHGRKSAHGTIFGLIPSHGRAELVRALMEGVAFWLRDNLEALHRLGIAPAHPEIIAIGGPTRATLLMQIKADITSCRIRVPQIEEAGATGAALLAGMGIGAFHSGEEAAAALHHDETTYTPQQEAQVVYDDIYHQTYLPACQTVLSLRSV
jgi:xylulokinase